ncbi:(2Fe-2S) ferredoxin domain-containing protein [Engelhardtia mirabilis]|uniref:Ferredoxin, 2Fe-2S n=1 Tax=Engelhardtia mirabilis TaxID=2528011 RepID=A0A518BHP8_9BACT|nr:Ferredoxin, 2Fe-2S [Planctomycetes bacterium Pla133]QDV00812.1 Ferredoxin, 2Fe-2S [Planctomycetes bacterium Pla86]
MAKFERHLFVCTNRRPDGSPRGCCASKGGEEIAAAFKAATFERGLKRVVRAQKAGCLDQCDRGVTVVVYPDEVWYGGVTLADVDEIVDSHLVRGEPVQRLVIPDDQLTGIERPSA